MLNNNYKIKPIAMVVALVLGTSSVNAVDFNLGENEDILLQINSQLDIGSSWRLGDADPRFIGKSNGGTGGTSTTDDGNLNYDKGDAYSQIIKGVHDIQLSKDNFGAFVRVKYWYDYALKDKDVPHGNSNNGYTPNTPLSDDGFEDNTKFSGITLLDAYVYASFDVGDSPVDVRLGRQVVSWGESTFIQGGMNSSNPFDVAALRRPGADLKEGILPVGMLYVNAGLTENLSVEAFYQYEWEKTQIDGCGTYFSGADFAATGCNFVSVGPLGDQAGLAAGLAAERQADVEPDDGGQYGLAARYYSEALNDTEFGLYYLNIHSRLPLINAIRTSIPLATGSATPVFVPKAFDPTGGALAALNPAYNIEFPEDLKFYGLSFATNVSGVALSGELSYKPDTPVQISGPEILNGVLSEAPFLRYTSRVTGVGYGQESQGWDEFDVTQFQMTAIQFFDNAMGASRVTVIAEVGVILTDGVEDSNQHYGRNSVFGLGDFDAGGGINCTNLVAGGNLSGDCSADGFTTDSAWGYRLRSVWEYSDVFAGVSLKPTLSWSHDVSGYSPDPGQQFHEGRKNLGFSLQAAYQQKYTVTLGYNNYSGGSHNILEDKDLISLALGISY
ncbi:DUF1302 domain-containing protein [Colwellia sp. PAMC 21821]|uniref:DUF1302 domain-containing protein n=1 Tax=Colwellia sp. PAMC 21821 TaxID=1816219 RepID=UPI0009C1967F|nr:DUF1302 domain-containing protein [Colwellia sp. PAMC 21821]ARD44997.1 hypothetical protein A3Q33_12165 [Colwellia sp. PAMC 21821]